MKNIMKRMKSQYLAVFLVALFGIGLFSSVQATPVYAAVGACESDAGKNTDVCTTTVDSLVGSGSIAEKIINTLLFLVGIVSVIVIVIAGFRFVTADGDSQKVTQARNTVLYAVIGLVVAASAYAIVNFVLSRL